MRAQPRYQLGDRIGGRYLVHKALMGGMGEVYLCLDLETNLPYALKTFQLPYLTNQQRLRPAFEQEVATWIALEKHPNIVRCFALIQLDYQPFMLLEWVAGEEGRGTDLRSWLRRGPFDLKPALEVAIDICSGLLHAQVKQPGLVHRDLKPENILIAQGGLAKVTDFGLAQIAQTAGLAVAVAEPGVTGRPNLVTSQGIAGTPVYMAPEQWRGEPLDERTDIYALGCILYELLTGVCPFQVDFTPTWLHAMQTAHERGRIPDLPATLPAPLNHLLQLCLAKAPSARVSGLADLLTQLNTLYRKHVGHAPPLRPAAGVFSAFDYNDRGNTYDTLGRYPEALADYTQAIRLDPNFVQAYSNRGTTYQTLGQPNAALDDFGRAIQLDPNDAQAYSNRGITYNALDQHTQALADFSRAIQLDPNTVKAYANRGVTYAALGQYAQALADFGRAIQLDASYAEAYYNRGLAYVELDRRDLALADFDQTLALDRNNVHAYANRGNLYAGFRQYEPALADFDQALALDPNDVITVHTGDIGVSAVIDNALN